jgi:hypothetical protein
MVVGHFVHSDVIYPDLHMVCLELSKIVEIDWNDYRFADQREEHQTERACPVAEQP